MNKKLIISTEIDGAQLVEDVLVTAFEGGSNYWYWIKIDEHWFDVAKRYDIETAKKENPKRTTPLPLTVRISNALLNVENFSMNIYDLEDTDHKLGELTKENFVKGCELCATKWPHVWENLMTESYDCEDCDVLFQLAVMGDVVFG